MRGIRIAFRGQEYAIPAHKAFALGERIEDIATIPEIVSWGQGKPRFFKLARCFAEMLRFAGAKVTAEDVHEDMMAEIKAAGGKADGEAGQLVAAVAVQALIALLMDGAPTADADDSAAPAGKPSTA